MLISLCTVNVSSRHVCAINSLMDYISPLLSDSSLNAGCLQVHSLDNTRITKESRLFHSFINK